MLVTVDKSELTAQQRELPYKNLLTELVVAVGTANPLLTFACDKNCLAKEWNRELPNGNGGSGAYEEKIYKVKVYQDGELLGALHSNTRYRRSVGAEEVYGVESFRISKERGAQSTTYTKDLKVALRTAKKMLVARANEELYAHVYNIVRNQLRNFENDMRNGVRYSIDVSTEAMTYAELAYKAHLQGKTTVEMPVQPSSVRNYEEYLTRCAQFKLATSMLKGFTDKTGYAVKLLDDNQIVVVTLADDSVTKYRDFDALPADIASKFAMFKVLQDRDPYEHIGVGLGEKFYYVVQ